MLFETQLLPWEISNVILHTLCVCVYAHDAILAFALEPLCFKRPTSLFCVIRDTRFTFSNPLGVIRYREPVPPPPIHLFSRCLCPLSQSGPDMIRWKKKVTLAQMMITFNNQV